jgi:hypothetical protein
MYIHDFTIHHSRICIVSLSSTLHDNTSGSLIFHFFLFGQSFVFFSLISLAALVPYSKIEK